MVRAELMVTVKEMLENVISRIESIVGLYRAGDEEKANERIIFLIDDLAVLLEGIVESQFEWLEVDELNEKLQSLVEQLENKDYLFVSDLLMYELLPLLQHWSGNIHHD